MTTFDERERAFELKFVHDEELRFKALARRNKLLGLWAAGRLGLTGAETDAYGKELVLTGLQARDQGAVAAKVLSDLSRARVETSEDEVHATMDTLLAQAVEEIGAGR